MSVNGRTARWLGVFLAAVLLACVVSARGGDGGDYSGDGSSSSGSSGSSSSSGSDWSSSSSDDYDYGDSDSGGSGSGSGGGGLEGLLVILVVFGLAFGSIIYATLRDSARNKRKRRAPKPRPSPPPSLEPLKSRDPDFSPVLFTAFAHLVYVSYHESRGGMTRHSKEEFAVAPYLSEKLRQTVRDSRDTILQVIVGEMHISALDLDEQDSRICVNFKSNIVYQWSRGRRGRMLVNEQMVFSRPRDVRTLEPVRVLALGCPACGSKQQPEITGRCPSCGEISGNGQMDWQVTAVHELKRPKQVNDSVSGGGGVEPGTDLPTVMDPSFKTEEQTLKTRDPEFSWSDLTERVRVIFLKLQEGWTEREESILRPYELDRVYDAHRIWLGRYREEGVRNVLEQIKIEYIKPVKIEHDRWYDSITVRIRASMIDYKVRDDGRHLSGRTSKRKVFSEYHTFVRRSGLRGSTTYDPLKCPQCGAPLDKVNQLGICAYCDTRITTGEFDWVLAMIVQDEEYTG